jgi:hypothetical protein
MIEPEAQTRAVESICNALARLIAPSTYYAYKAREADPTKQSGRRKRDTAFTSEIHRVWEAKFKVYGGRTAWRQLVREGFRVACDLVRRVFSADRPNQLWNGRSGLERSREAFFNVAIAGAGFPRFAIANAS